MAEVLAVVLRPLSVMKNVVGWQTDDAGNIGQNSSAHVARVVGLQTDAVVVTETRFRIDGVIFVSLATL